MRLDEPVSEYPETRGLPVDRLMHSFQNRKLHPPLVGRPNNCRHCGVCACRLAVGRVQAGTAKRLYEGEEAV